MTTASAGSTSVSRAVLWIRDHAVWLCIVFAHVTVFPYAPRINNPNENVRVYMTRALVEHHQLAINQVEREWGWVNDKAKAGDRVFSGKAPGASLLGVPVLAAETWLWHRLRWPSPTQRAATWALRVFAVMLPMCIFYLALGRYLRRLLGDDPMADLLLVSIALGSLLYPYGVHFAGHAQAAALSFAAFMALAPAGTISQRRASLIFGGLFAGLGVVFEYQNLIVAALLTVYVAINRPRGVPWFFLGALPSVAILGLMHYLCFGKPWAFPYGHLENAEFQTFHVRGFHGLALPELSAIGGILSLPGYGLFVTSPAVCLASIVGIGSWIRNVFRRPRGQKDPSNSYDSLVSLKRVLGSELTLVTAVAGALLLFLAGISNWRGGWSVGPRYITAIVPYLTLSLAYAWPNLRGSKRAGWWFSLVFGLTVAGVFFNALPAWMYPQYPTQLRNPLFQLILPLPFAGFIPESLAHSSGVKGMWSLLPTLLAVLGALAFPLIQAMRSQGGRSARLPLRWREVSLAAVVVFALVAPLSRWPRTMAPAERDAIAFVKNTWTPVPKRLNP